MRALCWSNAEEEDAMVGEGVLPGRGRKEESAVERPEWYKLKCTVYISKWFRFCVWCVVYYI